MTLELKTSPCVSLEESSERVALVPETHDPVLVVSEDPSFIFEMQRLFNPLGVRVLGCLGPAQAPCPMDSDDGCPMAEHCSIVLVDSPRSGVCARHCKEVPVGVYASALARRHPFPFVVVAGAPIGCSGPTGEVTQVADRNEAVDLIRWAKLGRSAVHELAVARLEGS